MAHGERVAPGESAESGSPVAVTAALLEQPFTGTTVTALRHRLAAVVADAGVPGPAGEDFVLAVHELITNAVRHGGGSGRLELRRLADVLICDIVDRGRHAEGLPVTLPRTDRPGGRGLWLAHHLTGSLILTRRPDGVTATVSVCVTPEASPTGDGKPAQRLDQDQ